MGALLKQQARRLRPMRADDLPQILAIEARAYPFPWPQEYFTRCLSNDGFYTWVLEEGGEILGYGVMAVYTTKVHILNLCVRPEQQGKGLGTHILTHMLDRARQRGAQVALLEVRPSNQPARNLYTTLGFTRAGVRRGYYPAKQGREDALILARRL